MIEARSSNEADVLLHAEFIIQPKLSISDIFPMVHSYHIFVVSTFCNEDELIRFFLIKGQKSLSQHNQICWKVGRGVQSLNGMHV